MLGTPSHKGSLYSYTVPLVSREGLLMDIWYFGPSEWPGGDIKLADAQIGPDSVKTVALGAI